MILRNLIRLIAPEQLSGRMILPLKSIGLSITDTQVTATAILLKGTSIVVEKIVSEALPTDNEPLTEKIGKVVAKVMAQMGDYHRLSSVMPSSQATFKELNFPFNSREKIAPTLIYKLESVLPFQLQDLNIDFIITAQNESKTETYVTASALQSKLVAEHVQMLLAQKIEPNTVTLDTLCLYGLYSYTTSPSLQGCVVLFNSTVANLSITILDDERFSYTRQLATARLSKERILQEIELILSSYLDNNPHITAFEKIVIMHDEQNLKDVMEQKFNIPVFLFKCNPSVITFPEHLHSKLDYVSLAAALPLLKTSDFDINTKLDHTTENKIVYRQLILASGLMFSIIGFLGTHVFFQLSKLSRAYESARTEILTTLKKEFPLINTSNIDDFLIRAQKEVKTEEGIWSSFSTKTRQSYLEYVSTLSQKIDRQGLGLSLSKMMINKKAITLEGKVKNYDAISQLQRQLQDTGLFVSVPDLQKTDFSVSLPLEQRGGL